MKHLASKLGLIALFIMILTISVSAHSGRTDSSGGHRDNNNVSGLGYYHYHCGGYPAHLHPGGVCPYSSGYTSNPEPRPTPTPRPRGQITNPPSEPVVIGESVTLEAENSSIMEIEVEPTDLAEVQDDTIVITGEGEGTVKVTFTNGDTDSFKIVGRHIYPESIEPIDDIRLEAGELCVPQIKIKPDNATYTECKWESSDTECASVTSDGKIRGVSPGTAAITVSTANEVQMSFQVEVYQIFPKHITNCPIDLNIELFETYQLHPSIIPADATIQDLKYHSYDENIIHVDNDGFVEAVGEGTTALLVEAHNGVKKDISVSVYRNPVTDVEFSLVNDKGKLISPNENSEYWIWAGNYTYSTQIIPDEVTIGDYDCIITTAQGNRTISTALNSQMEWTETEDYIIDLISLDGFSKRIKLHVQSPVPYIAASIVTGGGLILAGTIIYKQIKVNRSQSQK